MSIGKLHVSPFQTTFKVINLKKLFAEDLLLATWFLTYVKSMPWIPLSLVLDGWILKLGRLEKN